SDMGTNVDGDWDPYYYKGECAAGEYVAGISQSTSLQIQSILCCPGQVTHANCAAKVFELQDGMEDHSVGDWDPGYYKGSCGTTNGFPRYVAGVSRDTSNTGYPHAILCCSP